MNNLKKIGLTAIAASLATVSAHAADFSVTGGASMFYSSNSNVGSAGQSNPWTMSDTVNFAASGELDNGWTVDYSLGLDGNKGAAASPFEDRTLKIGMGSLGTLTLNGEDGSTVTGAMDDKMPTAYEETWFGTNAAGNPQHTSGANNMFNYSNTSVDGINLMASYVPSSGNTDKGSIDVGVTYTGVEGVTIGLATGEENTTSATSSDATSLYVTYAYDAFTFGVQNNELDSSTANADSEYRAYAISYAVSDDMSVSIGMSENDYEGTSATTDETQEATAISASYTMGSMSFAATRADTDNNGGNRDADGENYEISLAFAF